MGKDGTPAPRVLICGYYGEHNLGDDALLEVLLEQLPSPCIPVVTAHDQLWLEQRFGVPHVGRRHLRKVLRSLASCDALVLGGGSLLQDATSVFSLLYYAVLILAAHWQGKPVLLWGQGLGPLTRRRSRLVVRRLLPMATAISWRDSNSADQAAAWGIRAPVGSDPVWALPARTWTGRGGPIVLCWRPVASLDDDAWLLLLDALDQMAAETCRNVLWLPFHQKQDRGLLEQLDERGLVPSALLHRSREVIVNDPIEAMTLFSGAGLVVAMRLHALILAALAGSPCFALSYDPKVAAAAAGIGCPCQVLAEPITPHLRKDLGYCLDQPPDPLRLVAEKKRTEVHRQVLRRLVDTERSRSSSASTS